MGLGTTLFRVSIMSKRNQLGFTLIEFILGLVISMIVVATVLAVGISQRQDQEAVETEFAVTSLKAQAQNAYSQSMGFMTADGTPITTQDLFSYGQIFPRGVVNTAPPGTVPTDSQITNDWGGTIAVSADNSVPTSPAPCGGAARPPYDLLRITLTKVPAKACSQMVGTLAPQSYDTYVNGSLVALDPAPSSAGPGRSSVRYSQAAPLCNHDQNTLVFRSLKPLALYTLRSYPPTTNLTPSESACTLPEYNRVQNAMAAREAAQAAL